MTDYASILAAASQLPDDERVRLIDDLWCSEAAPLPQAWLDEIRRRSAQLDKGEVQPVSWETVRDDALRRAGIRDAD